VIILNSLRGVLKIISRFPGKFFFSPFIASPLYQILEFPLFGALVDARVDDSRHCKLLSSVDDNRRWRRLGTTREGIGGGRFQHRDVKDRMYSAHRVGKAEGEGKRAGLSNYFIGA